MEQVYGYAGKILRINLSQNKYPPLIIMTRWF